MTTVNTIERALVQRIACLLTRTPERTAAPVATERPTRERPAVYSAGWIAGEPDDYDRSNCVDIRQLSAFLNATQPEVASALSLDSDNTTRRQFLARLKGEIRNRGVIDILRRGINHRQHRVDLFYGVPFSFR